MVASLREMSARPAIGNTRESACFAIATAVVGLSPLNSSIPSSVIAIIAGAENERPISQSGTLETPVGIGPQQTIQGIQYPCCLIIGNAARTTCQTSVFTK